MTANRPPHDPARCSRKDPNKCCDNCWELWHSPARPASNGKLRKTAPAPAIVGNSLPAPTGRPFPLTALPEPVRGYVDACAAAIGCDLSYVALPVLTVLAGAIGNARRVRIKRSWTEPAILWTAIVGESGTQKSPALDHAREFPRRRQAEAMKRHRAALAEYETALLTYQADLAAWKRRKGNRGEPPQPPDEPALARCLIDDTTVEAVAPILLQNPRGALILKDELAGWLGGFDRYAGKGRSGSDAAKWIEMHGGRPVLIDRKTGTPRTIYIPLAAVSVAGGIQPGILRRLIVQEHRDNGLLARLLMAWRQRRPRKWTEAEPAKELTMELQRVYDALWTLAMDTDSDGASVPRLVPLTPAAKSAFIAFVNEHGQEQYHLDGDLAAAWSKLEGYAARLALVHHLVRWAADPAAIDQDHIDADSLEAGINLVRWFADEDRRIYAALDESADDADRRELVDLIRRRGGTITVRQLQQATRRYSTADAAETAISGLVKTGLGAWRMCPPSLRGGQSTRVFELA